jgi:hypothetical protein
MVLKKANRETVGMECACTTGSASPWAKSICVSESTDAIWAMPPARGWSVALIDRQSIDDDYVAATLAAHFGLLWFPKCRLAGSFPVLVT